MRLRILRDIVILFGNIKQYVYSIKVCVKTPDFNPGSLHMRLTVHEIKM